MKKVIKFKFQDKEGLLSVVEKSNHYYTLVKKDTLKVMEIKNTKKLWVAYEINQPDYQEVEVDVIYDQSLIQWVYKALEEANNLYFKALDDRLCVLKIAKE